MAEEAPDPARMIADKGYDSQRIRDDLKARGAEPIIPPKANRKAPEPFDKAAYKLRNRIERSIGRLKNARSVATRYAKLAESFLGFIHLTAIKLWIKFVHTA
jgi:transposase